MTPQATRIAMVAVGAGCLVAAALLPTYSQYLAPAGIGLLAWAKSAPGDAPKNGV